MGLTTSGLGMAATVNLDSVYRVVAKSGVAYYYAWKGKGAPRLHAEPGSAAFHLRQAVARPAPPAAAVAVARGFQAAARGHAATLG